MACILALVSHQDGKLKKASLSSVSAARALSTKTGAPVVAAAIGSGLDGVAQDAAAYGPSKVVVVDHAQYKTYMGETFAACVAELAKKLGAKAVVANADTFGKDCLPRVAAKLHAPMVSEVMEVIADSAKPQFKRPMYAGNVIATVEVSGEPVVLTVRGTSFAAPEKATQKAPVEKLDNPVSTPFAKAAFKEFQQIKSERPELVDASVIVAGGRGLKTPEDFRRLLEPLADTLGAAIGATRAVVDAGWVPNDSQVGQTGKVVAPTLYMAFGISGAIQHVAGMKDSKVIVAVNRDGDAPIFEVADYGIVGDAFKVIPELTEKIKALKAEQQ
ncbi:MAG: electron transfer flavoprotein subunit alpha/FixB family protein [Nitrospirae bacterium]|nr:electron transfer flavoprotein subunit alpha/FixB family protein [Nitrospirota bacterium]